METLQTIIEPPIGTITAWAGKINDLPANWLPCDGLMRNRTDFPKLAEILTGLWGNPSPISGTTFKTPDLNGYFLRGNDNNSGRDPDATQRTDGTGNIIGGIVGSYQQDEYRHHGHEASDLGHSHSFSYRTEGAGNPQNQADGGDDIGFYKTEGGTTSTASAHIRVAEAGGKESRPKNACVYWIIRAK